MIESVAEAERKAKRHFAGAVPEAEASRVKSAFMLLKVGFCSISNRYSTLE
jgi:hypothetical protein